MKYLYESHLGGLYTSDEQISHEDLYCDGCNDYDFEIGHYNNIKEFWDLIKDDCDIDSNGGWSMQYIYPFIVEEFNLPYQIDFERNKCFCNNALAEIMQNINREINNCKIEVTKDETIYYKRAN